MSETVSANYEARPISRWEVLTQACGFTLKHIKSLQNELKEVQAETSSPDPRAPLGELNEKLRRLEAEIALKHYHLTQIWSGLNSTFMGEQVELIVDEASDAAFINEVFEDKEGRYINDASEEDRDYFVRVSGIVEAMDIDSHGHAELRVHQAFSGRDFILYPLFDLENDFEPTGYKVEVANPDLR